MKQTKTPIKDPSLGASRILAEAMRRIVEDETDQDLRQAQLDAADKFEALATGQT